MTDSKQIKQALLCTLAAACIAAPSLAASPYREDAPPVMQPPPLAAPVDIITPAIKHFQARYQTTGRPRIALFWNVELVDSLEDQMVKTRRLSGGTHESVNSLEETTAGEAGKAKLVEGEAKSSIDLTATETTRRISANVKRRTELSERDMWKTETSFTSTMREAGVRFIDRNTILRTSALTEGTENTRALETRALLGKADLLMEVLMTQDPDAPLGWGFRMNLRNIKTGEDRASLYTEALPIISTPSRTRFHATDTGFTKVVEEPQATVQDVGRALAVEVMSAIASTEQALAK